MSEKVIVVGAGNAATAAALSAKEAGADVVMLEKASEEERGGNTRFTFGLMRFAFDDPSELHQLMPGMSAAEWKKVEIEPYPQKTFYDAIMKTGDYLPDPTLTDWLVSESRDVIDWMTKFGVTWEFAQLMATAVGGKRVYSGGLVLQTKGKGEGLIEMQTQALKQSKIEVRYSTAVTALLTDNSGAITGVRTRNASGSYQDMHGPVVLASGGFQANPEMRTRYLGPEWNVIKIRGSRHDSGELLLEALRVGGQPFGHWSSAHATMIDPDSPDLGDLSKAEYTTRTSFSYGITVNKLGKRFFDEAWDWPSQTYVRMGKAVMKQLDGVAFQIFDQTGVDFIDPQYSTQAPIVADTLEELAKKCGIDAEALLQTVREFNAAIDVAKPFNASIKDERCTRGLPVPKSHWSTAIETGPFVAYKVISGLTFTFGGMKVDRNSQVLDFSDQPIPGLYATGELTGGFFYNSYPAGSGLTRGSLTGRAAGRHAARLSNC